MMQKSTTFTTILRVKKCHFHYDMQKNIQYVPGLSLQEEKKFYF
jgi:hypothetical protein